MNNYEVPLNKAFKKNGLDNRKGIEVALVNSFILTTEKKEFVIDTDMTPITLSEKVVGEEEREVLIVALKYHQDNCKTLHIGYAICHPDDEWDKEVGYNIALKRAINSEPFLSTKFSRTMSKDIINSSVNSFIRHMTEHYENYLKS